MRIWESLSSAFFSAARSSFLTAGRLVGLEEVGQQALLDGGVPAQVLLVQDEQEAVELHHELIQHFKPRKTRGTQIYSKIKPLFFNLTAHSLAQRNICCYQIDLRAGRSQFLTKRTGKPRENKKSLNCLDRPINPYKKHKVNEIAWASTPFFFFCSHLRSCKFYVSFLNVRNSKFSVAASSNFYQQVSV